jgi:MFS family permease
VHMRATATQAGWPSPVHAWYIAALLACGYLISLIDRLILSLLVQPIKRDLAISDTKMSFLMGVGFALFYATLAIPLARLADRTSRIRILTVGMTIWSLMTAFAGTAHTYWVLFLARTGVGIGESTLTPATYSLLSDLFPRERLTRAIALYSIGGEIGVGCAFVLGGAVVERVRHLTSVALPIVGELYPWQLAFLIVALPGLLLAAVIALTVKEPRRHQVSRQSEPVTRVPLPEGLRFIAANRRVLLAAMVGVGLQSIATFGYYAWVPTFLIRKYGWHEGKAGLYYGLVAMISGVAGALLGGWLGDQLWKRGVKDAPLKASAVLIALATVPAALAPHAGSSTQSVLWWGLAYILYEAPYIMIPAAIQVITPNRLRATVSAIYLLIVNAIGAALGPTVVATLSNGWIHHDGGLENSLTVVPVLCFPLAAIVYCSGLSAFRTAIDTSNSDSTGDVPRAST